MVWNPQLVLQQIWCNSHVVRESTPLGEESNMASTTTLEAPEKVLGVGRSRSSRHSPVTTGSVE